MVTARYSIWENCNNRPRCGTPAKIAREIKDSMRQAQQQGQQDSDWTITHAWSYFTKADGTNEDAENMSQPGAENQGGIRGLSPVVWCTARINPKDCNITSAEEMIWRLRMQHNPQQTKELLELK